MKKTLVTLFCISSFLFCELPSYFSEAQAKRWEEMEAAVDLIRDGCGMPIDTKIKEIVIALNLLGVETSQSCEGHLNWGFPFPWVEILPRSQIDELICQRDEVLEEMDEIETEIFQLYSTDSLSDLEVLYDKLAKKSQDNFRLLALIEQRCFEQENRLWDFLEEFYGKRDSFKEGTLIVQEGRLFPLGGHWQNRYSEEQREENLQSYQKEIELFKDFLLIKFSTLTQ